MLWIHFILEETERDMDTTCIPGIRLDLELEKQKVLWMTWLGQFTKLESLRKLHYSINVKLTEVDNYIVVI